MLPIIPYIYHNFRASSSQKIRSIKWSTRVNPYLYVVIFLAWLCTLGWFHPRLVSILDLATTPWERGNLWFFIVFIELAWLYGLYNIFLVIFASLYKGQKKNIPPWLLFLLQEPAVAILYTTCNDFCSGKCYFLRTTKLFKLQSIYTG